MSAGALPNFVATKRIGRIYPNVICGISKDRSAANRITVARATKLSDVPIWRHCGEMDLSMPPMADEALTNAETMVSLTCVSVATAAAAQVCLARPGAHSSS